MRSGGRNHLGVWLKIFVFAACAVGTVDRARATELVLKDGRVLRGKLAKVSGLVESPQATKPDGGGAIQSILMLDDELRRTFFSERLVAKVSPDENRQVEEKFSIRQRVLRSGPSIQSVGQPLRVEPFDEFGRRIFTMAAAKGPLDIIQGITELTPEWTKVEGISHVWDMRIATSSIPHNIAPENPPETDRSEETRALQEGCPVLSAKRAV